MQMGFKELSPIQESTVHNTAISSQPSRLRVSYELGAMKLTENLKSGFCPYGIWK